MAPMRPAYEHDRAHGQRRHGAQRQAGYVAIWVAAPAGARHELVAADPANFVVPPFGGHDWVGMRSDIGLDGPDWSEVREIIVDAYRQVAPTTLVALLPPTRGAEPGA